MKKLLFNLTFYPLFVAVTLVMPAVVIIPVLIIRLFVNEREILRIIRKLIHIYGVIIIRGLTYPFVRTIVVDRAAGKRNGPCIYVCNHRASSDAFLMVHLRREAIQVVNKWPFKIPVLGWVARIAGYLSVRTMPFDEFVKKARAALSEGVSIAAFPEGSRSPDKTVQQFNGAVFRVAQAARVPIVPVCLSGNQKIPLKGSLTLTPGTIRVHLLEPLEWETFKDMTPFKLKNTVRELIQREVDKLEN